MLQFFTRHASGCRQLFAACEVAGGAVDFGLTHGDGRLQLRRCREHGPHITNRARKLCFGLLERDLRIGLVELHQRLALLDELRIVRADRNHDAGNLRCDLHNVAVDVGVVRRLQIAQRNSPVRAVADANGDKGKDDDGQPTLAIAAHRRGSG